MIAGLEVFVLDRHYGEKSVLAMVSGGVELECSPAGVTSNRNAQRSVSRLAHLTGELPMVFMLPDIAHNPTPLQYQTSIGRNIRCQHVSILQTINGNTTLDPA